MLRSSLLLILALLVAPALAEEEKDPYRKLRGELDAVTGVADGVKRATFIGRPPMFFVFTRTCSYSLRLAEVVFADRATVELIQARFTPVLVDVATDPAFATKHRLKGTPHVLFTDREGKVVGHVKGAVSVSGFRKTLDSAREAVGDPKPSKEFRELERQAEELRKAAKEKRLGDATRLATKIAAAETECQFTAEARDLLKEFEGLAAERLKKAKRLMSEGHPDLATPLLRSILEDFPGLPSAKEAETLLRPGKKPD